MQIAKFGEKLLYANSPPGHMLSALNNGSGCGRIGFLKNFVYIWASSTMARFQKIDELFRLFYKPMCIYATHYLGNTEGVEDIVQDAFLSLWQKMEDGLEPASPKSYLSSIVHNACVDRLRREASHPVSGLPSDMEAPVSDEEALDRSFAEAWLWTAIDELPEGRRRMLLMHKREGLSCAEIASRLGVSEGTVKNQISRALKSLRKGAWKIFS